MKVIPTEALFDQREELVRQIDSGALTSEQAMLRALEWDPFDTPALCEVGRCRRLAGETEEAWQYYWRAVQSNPCYYVPYLMLASLAEEISAHAELMKGFMELAAHRLLDDEEARQELQQRHSPTEEFPDKIMPLADPENLELMAEDMLHARTWEPPGVTAELLGLRLIAELLDRATSGLHPELVTRIIAEGPAMTPLLVGVLREWVRKPDDEDRGTDPYEVSLALLGEIGDPEAAPVLVEFGGVEDDGLRATAEWALRRLAAQHPRETFEQLRQIEAGDFASQRALIAAQLATVPPMEGVAPAIARQANDLGSVDKEGRDDLLGIILASLAACHDPRGLELARATFEQWRSLVSRGARKNYEMLLEQAEAGNIVPMEQDDDPSIEDICCGRISLADEDEVDDDGELEDFFEVEPQPKPARNSPCWCGSGRKYKKCHLEEDEKAERERARSLPAKKKPEPDSPEVILEPPAWAVDGAGLKLREKIMEFSAREVSRREMEKALALYFHPSEGADEMAEKAGFLDWLMHDFVPSKFGRTVIEEFLDRNRRSLSPSDLRIVEAWARARYSFLEVQEVKAGEGVEVEDLFRGGRFFIHDVSISRNMERWDCFLSRVEEYRGRMELNGMALVIPRRLSRQLREWTLARQEESGLGWDDYLRAHSHRIRHKALEICEDSRKNLRMVSAEGDPLVFSNASYQVLDEPALRLALNRCAEIEQEELDAQIVWLEGTAKGESGRRVLGHLNLADGQLKLECNSRERLKRGRKLIEKLAGKALQHQRDQFRDWQEVKAEFDASNPKPTGREIPPEVAQEMISRYQDEHYAKWPDTRLPALDGKTPRQAMKTAAGRRQVEELIRDFENGEARGRRGGDFAYDFSKLRASLGL